MSAVRYISLDDALDIFDALVHRYAETDPIALATIELDRLSACLGLPCQTFGKEDLYPTIPSKAAAIAFSRNSVLP